MSTLTRKVIARVAMTLLLALCTNAAAWAETYTVRLLSGDPSLTSFWPISSDDKEEMASSKATAQDGQFYKEADGSMWFKLSPGYNPGYKKLGWLFAGWGSTDTYHKLTSTETIFTAQWVEGKAGWNITKSANGSECYIKAYYIANQDNLNFQAMEKLTTLTIPDIVDGAKVIGFSSMNFSDFPKLETLNFYANGFCREMPVVSVCTKLKNVNTVNSQGIVLNANELPISITTILPGAFAGTAIEMLTMPCVTEVKGGKAYTGAFEGCNSLTEVTFSKAANIPARAFANISSACTVNYAAGPLSNWDYTKVQGSPNLLVTCKDGKFGWCGSGDIQSGDRRTWTLANRNLTITVPNDAESDGRVLPTKNWSAYPVSFGISDIDAITLIGVSAIQKHAFKGLSKASDLYFEGTGTKWNAVTKADGWNNGLPENFKTHWRCTVTFDANGQGTAPAPQSNIWSNESTSPPPVHIVDGNIIICWYTDSDLTHLWNFKNPIPGDMTLYAYWETNIIFSKGNGTADAPYQISTTDGLEQLALFVNSGVNDFKGQHFKLINDIVYDHATEWDDASSTENNHTAIGYQNEGSLSFKGSFDGGGHTISGIRIYKGGVERTDDYQGLFGKIGQNGTVKNVTIANTRITGHNDTGSIAGSNDGNITNCHAAANVVVHAVKNLTCWHGGIVGRNYGTVNNCSSAANLTFSNSSNHQSFGGIGGINNGTVRNCTVAGAVIPQIEDAGAVVGGNDKKLSGNTYHSCLVGNNAFNIGVGDGDAADAALDATRLHLFDVRPNAALLAAYADPSHHTANNGTAPHLGKLNVTLQGRTFSKDGKWQTLCLPFGVTIADSPLAGAEARTLESATLSNGTLTMNFGEPVTTLEAGKSYIIKWADGDTIVSPTFSGVPASSLTATVSSFTSDDGKVTFTGSYSPMTFAANDHSKLFLADGDKPYWPRNDKKENAFRAYIDLGSNEAQSFVMNVGGKTVRGLLRGWPLATYLPGDVNNSGGVNATDLAMLIDYLLGRQPAGFFTEAADLNDDGNIDIVDVTLMIGNSH